MRAENWLGGGRFEVAAIVGFSAVGALGLAAQPAIAAQFDAQLGLTAGQVGALFTVEGLGGTLSSLLMLLRLRALSRSRMALAAVLLFVAANAASAAWLDYRLLLASRAAAGMAEGMLVVLSLSAAASMDNTDRVYGLWVIGQGGLGSLVLLALPALFSRFGLGGFYGGLALVMLPMIPLVRGLSSRPPVPAATREAAPRAAGRRAQICALLAATLCFYGCIGGVWAFAANRGIAEGISGETVTLLLAAASGLGIAGALVAAWIGRTERRVAMILSGQCLLGVALFVLGEMPGAAPFGLSVALVQLVWCFVAPFLLALAAELDPSGAVMAPLNLMLGSGLAGGPILVGTMIDRRGDVGQAAVMPALLLAVSLLLMLGLAVARRMAWRNPRPSFPPN